jgi:hypothetical protein
MKIYKIFYLIISLFKISLKLIKYLNFIIIINYKFEKLLISLSKC